ncbi:hypothetical protein GLE_0056 [Lysobacter enzymogenes]|uniref:Uncharacterized protein n=1 Tax=Lysobacter enzymogenes TaxID=69 RepID=A0A0S2DA57_LYSEN|nr:hypothetical protein GLE_0056 [Lysobacter enzymogenes]
MPPLRTSAAAPSLPGIAITLCGARACVNARRGRNRSRRAPDPILFDQ